MLGKTNQDEFAMGSSNENSATGPCEPLGPERACRAAPRAERRRRWRPALRRGRSAPTPAARSGNPRRCAGMVGLKPTYGSGQALRDDRVRLVVRPVRAAHPRRDGRGLLMRHMTGRDPCDSTSLGHPEPIELPRLIGSTACSSASRRSCGRGRARGAALLEVFERTLARIEELGGERRRGLAAAAGHGLSAYYVMAPAEASANLARYDGVRYGTAPRLRDLLACTRRPAPRASATRSAPHHARHLRALLGYYEAYYGTAQRVRTKIAQDSRARSSRSTWSSPDLADGGVRVGERTADLQRCTCPTTSPCRCRCGHPRRVDPAACPTARLACSSRARPSARTGSSTRPTRSSGRSALRGGAAVECRGVLSRSSAWRSTSSWRRRQDVLRLRAVLREPAQTHLPGLPGPPGVLPVVNARRCHALMIGLALGLRDRPAVALPPQELLLSGLSQGLPDLPVRHPACSRRPAGRRPDPPRRISRRTRPSWCTPARPADPRRRDRGSTSTGLAHPAGRDRDRAGPPLRARGGASLPHALHAPWGAGVSDVNMEEGSLRVDANVSIRRSARPPWA